VEKLLIFPGKTEQGVFTYLIDAEKSFLEKTACEYHPTIAAYINAAKPIKGKTQILLTALGAYEFWGFNVNGDAFPEAGLAHEGTDYGFKTFEHYAKIYKHHVNKDPTASYGDVALSVYNPKYHRVELIVVLDNAKAPDIAQRMEHGDYPDWSMGTRVPYDVCSICGNKAPTRKQYCEHLKYYLARMYPPLGKPAFAINPQPKFFDISQVFIGADRIAKTHMKVAHSTIVYPSSAWLAEKMAATDKSATIEKEVPAEGAPISQQSLEDLALGIMEVKSHEQPMSKDTLNTLARRPLSESMSTLAMLGILPKPQEFQRIFLVNQNHPEMADQLDQENCCFDPMSADEPLPCHEAQMPISASSFNPFLAELLKPLLAGRSYSAPLLGRRLVVMIKSANDYPQPRFIKVGADEYAGKKPDERKPLGIIPMLAIAAGLYAAFTKNAPKEALKGLDKVLAGNPGLAAALGLGLFATFNPLVKPGTKGDYMDGPRHNPDSNDSFARAEAMKQKPYVKLGSIGSGAKRLLLGIPLAYMASGVLQKHRELNPYDEEGRIKSFFRKNPDAVSGALIADAIMSAKGGGTHGVFKKLAPVGKVVKDYFAKAASALEDYEESSLIKAASAQEFLSSSLIWPLAMGKANLPGRIVSGMFDQAALDLGQKLYEKHSKGKKRD